MRQEYPSQWKQTSLETKTRKLIRVPSSSWTLDTLRTRTGSVAYQSARVRGKAARKASVGLVWNEISRRYVDFTPEFHAPEAWRKRAPDKKQGSLNETFEGRDEERFDEKYWDLMTRCETIYNNMLASGVAPEQARMVLPQSMMTEWYWTGSLAAFGRVVSQRISEDAQYECRVVAEKIDQLLVNHEPISYSWSCLTGRV